MIDHAGPVGRDALVACQQPEEHVGETAVVIAGRSGRACTCLARISAGGSSSSVLNASESAWGCSVKVVVLTLAKRSGAGANDREQTAMSETGVQPR